MAKFNKSACFPFVSIALISGLISCATVPPRGQENICEIFRQYPSWYDYSHQSEKKWGTPKHIQMAFIRQESSFVANARPPFKWFLFIPLGRGSSAEGYAQAQDAVWKEYEAERGSLFRGRSDIEDALDFIGWYNNNSHQRLGLGKQNARELYLAYHEGHTGYRRKSFQRKPWLLKVSERVERKAQAYKSQLAGCEAEFRCRKFWQFWPFCS